MEEIVKGFADYGVTVKNIQDYIRGECPFRENHDAIKDGSNSFFLSFERNAYHCWSCGAKGNAVALLTKHIGLPFSVAVKPMVDRIGTAFDPEEISEPEEVTLSHDFSKPPKKYLDRGMTEKTLSHFKVGSEQTKHHEKTCVPYFQDGEIVCIKKQWIGLGGKREFEIVGNLPDGFLYNFHDTKIGILVEGESDVWNLYQQGQPYGVSTITSSITEMQAMILRRYEVLYVMYDNDWAGIKGAENAYQYLKGSVELRFVPYEEDDPGTIKRRALLRALKNSVGYLEYSTRMTMTHGDDYLDVRARVNTQHVHKNKV